MTILAPLSALAPVELIPTPGMVLCRLGETRTKPGAVFGPTQVLLFVVESLEMGWLNVRSVYEPGRTERHALTAANTLRLASAPNKVSFSFVADSLADMGGLG